MELRTYLTILRRRMWVLAIVAAATLLVAAAGTFLMPPVYVASTTLRITTATSRSGEHVSYDSIMYATRLLNTYSKIATGDGTLDELARRLSLSERPRVRVEVPANSELMQISVEGRDPALAAEAASALVEILIARAAIRPEAVSVLEPASAPEAPARPRKALNMAVALLLGLVGGAGMAFLVERLDSRLYTARHVEEAVDLAILGAVPTAPRGRRGALFDASSPEHEALRRVRAHLLEPDRGARPRSVLVTSAEPGEGKSTVASNLAVSIAQTGRSTVVVDGDLRLPSLHRIFDLPNEVGLSDLLRQGATLDQVVQISHVPGVRVITSGRLPPNPAELLGSCAMAAVLEKLAGCFDAIVLDGPSLLAVADALALAPAVDGVLLVVGRAQARAETVRSARDELIRAQARSVGVVVNRAEPDGHHGYYRRATVGA